MSHAHRGAFNLTVSRLTAKLSGDFEDPRDASHANGMTFREQSSTGIDRYSRRVAPRCARVNKCSGATWLTKTQIVVVQQLGGCETIVQLD